MFLGKKLKELGVAVLVGSAILTSAAGANYAAEKDGFTFGGGRSSGHGGANAITSKHVNLGGSIFGVSDSDKYLLAGGNIFYEKNTIYDANNPKDNIKFHSTGLERFLGIHTATSPVGLFAELGIGISYSNLLENKKFRNKHRMNFGYFNKLLRTGAGFTFLNKKGFGLALGYDLRNETSLRKVAIDRGMETKGPYLRLLFDF